MLNMLFIMKQTKYLINSYVYQIYIMSELMQKYSEECFKKLDLLLVFVCLCYV